MLKLNLFDLTPEHLAEAQPHLGVCRYAAPCIIGTLIPPEERERLDQGMPTVHQLVNMHLVSFPDKQLQDAEVIQGAFDSGDWDDVLRIAHKYMRP